MALAQQAGCIEKAYKPTNHADWQSGRKRSRPGSFYQLLTQRPDLRSKTLRRRLRRHNRDAWVDLEGIEPSEEWLNKLYSAIDSTQAFVFIISESSVASPYCEEEIGRARESNKKIIPILYGEVAPERLPQSLAKLQWISFQDEKGFDSQVDELIKALDTDLDWINEHTRLLVRSRQWESKGRDKSYLLRGTDLKDAEQWLIEAPLENGGQPTALQSTYISASAQTQRRSRSLLLAGTTAAAIIAGVLGIAAMYQRNQAQANERQAVSRLLAAQATAGVERNFNLSLLLAVAAYQRAPTFEAHQVLQTVIEASPHLAKYFYGQSQRVQRLAFDSSATLLVSSSTDGSVIVWNTVSGKEVFRKTANSESAPGIAISAEAKLLAIGGRDGTMRLVDVDDGETLDEIKSALKSNITVAAFSADGKRLAWGDNEGQLTIWNVQERKVKCIPTRTDQAI